MPCAGREAGAENDGWQDRDSAQEAASYYNAVVMGDLGNEILRELEQASGEFDSVAVSERIEMAKKDD
ncbi:MAG: hypothetical protein AAGD07_24635 [Planctomycetota bacterium]